MPTKSQAHPSPPPLSPQPRSQLFHQFDRLLIMHRGTTAYFGPAADAAGYFESSLNLKLPALTNPADFILDALDGIMGGDASLDADAVGQRFLESSFCKDVEQEREDVVAIQIKPVARPPSTLVKTVWLMQRTWLGKLRGGSEFIVTPVVVVILGLLSGILFYHLPVNDDGGDQWHRLNVVM